MQWPISFLLLILSAAPRTRHSFGGKSLSEDGGKQFGLSTYYISFNLFYWFYFTLDGFIDYLSTYSINERVVGGTVSYNQTRIEVKFLKMKIYSIILCRCFLVLIFVIFLFTILYRSCSSCHPITPPCAIKCGWFFIFLSEINNYIAKRKWILTNFSNTFHKSLPTNCFFSCLCNKNQSTFEPNARHFLSINCKSDILFFITIKRIQSIFLCNQLFQNYVTTRPPNQMTRLTIVR